MLAGVLHGSSVHAQSRTAVFGFGNPSLRYALAPDSYSGWRNNHWPRCRQFGLGMLEDLGSHFQPHFLWAADPVWRIDPLIARARGEAGKGVHRRFFRCHRCRGVEASCMIRQFDHTPIRGMRIDVADVGRVVATRPASDNALYAPLRGLRCRLNDAPERSWPPSIRAQTGRDQTGSARCDSARAKSAQGTQ